MKTSGWYGRRSHGRQGRERDARRPAEGFTANTLSAASLQAGGAVRGGRGVAAEQRPAYIACGPSGRSSRRTRIAMSVMMSASTVAPAPMVSAVVTPLDSA
jgi:hypothetical protein